MLEPKHYTCNYCQQDFVPKRRRVQKYCSNSCRSSAYQLRKGNISNLPATNSIIPITEQNDKMTLAGVGNAAVGSMVAGGLVKLFTNEKNKPATKGDIDLLIQKLGGRYHLVKNLQPNAQGALPYFDFKEGIIVYL
ncbi:hypothetical protein OOZ35_13010 [Mesoflavibacter profundi]|uniref:Uncharacterized protein n=1 Tax=Mesoflavibacter profundi TaxID=2708110 RepID=A0ABT4S2Z3_9FLAO|nr:hypothetical protein [Mesoflavibacter profundi]MDA0178414.1 hypothetical protein [Mesoflavibacter profundi]